MRNIRQRKIDPNKPMPVVIFYSLLNTYCNASLKSSTTQESTSTSSTTPTSELLETMMSKLKKTNGYRNIENHYRNISLRLSMSDLDEMKLIMKESGLDEETLKSIRHAQEIADDQANNYTYDHTLDSDAHEDGHHSSNRGGGLGNSRRGGSGAIKQSQHQSDQNSNSHPTESVIFTPFVNIIDLDDTEELPDFENGITPLSSSNSSVRSQFLETKEKKRRRNAEQRSSRKKVKFQPPPQYIHFHEKTIQTVEAEKIIYDMEDDDFEWLSNFHTKYLEEYEMCICDNSKNGDSLLKRWRVYQKDSLPTPSQVLNLFDEDFFEESIDRFEKTTAFSTDLCSFKSAINKFPSLGRLFFDIEIFTQETNTKTKSHVPRRSSEKLSRNNRFLQSSTIANKVDELERYKYNLFNQSTNNNTNSNAKPPTTPIQNPPQLEKSIISLGNYSRPSPSSSSTNNGYNNTITSLPSQQCTNNINNSNNSIRENNSKVLPTQFLYEIYLFWRSKRLSRRVTNTDKQLYPNCGKPLLVDFEKEPDINDQSHHAAFRLRELPKKQTEEIQNDEVSLYKLRKLKKDLSMLKDIMTKVNERETKKLDHVKLTRDILLFEKNNISEATSVLHDTLSVTNEDSLIIQQNGNEALDQPLENPYYEPISEETWNEQFSQDDSGFTSMNLLHFMEILKRHNRPFFPFLLQYIKKTRSFEGDEVIPEQFNTMLPEYVPGSEYNVSLSTKRNSILFDTDSLNEDELSSNEKRMDYSIDNLLNEEIEAQKKLLEQKEAAENNGTCSTEMFLSLLDEHLDQEEKEGQKLEPIGTIVEVQLSEFEEKSSNPNGITTPRQYPKANEGSFVYGEE